jgi:hypothetical protein
MKQCEWLCGWIPSVYGGVESSDDFSDCVEIVETNFKF